MAETIRLNNLENEFRLNAEAKAQTVIDEHLRAIAGRIRSIGSANTEKDIEDQLKSIDELDNGTYLLRQLLQNTQPSSNTYELEYVDLEAFGEDETGVATRRGQDVFTSIPAESLQFSPDQILQLKKKIVAYGIKTDIFEIPLVRLLRQNYTFSDFDLAATALVKQKLLNKDPVRIFNLKGPEGEISEGVFETLGLTDPDDFPDASLDNDLNEEFIEQYIRDSLVNSEVLVDPRDTADGFLGGLSNFFDLYPGTINFKTRIENDYFLFIENVIEDDEDVLFVQNQSSLLQKFNAERDRSVNSEMTLVGEKIDLINSGLYSLVARFIENARREQIAEDKRDLNELDPASDEFSDAVDQIEKKAIAELLDTPLGEDVTTLDEEDIKNRQRFFKQCALMMNLPKLAESFDNIIKNRISARTQQNTNLPTNNCQTAAQKFNNLPLDGRLYMVSNKEDQSATLSKMLNSEVAKELFEIPPAVLSSLVPKIRLYRVQKGEKGPMIKTEFVFDSSEDLNRERNYAKKTNFLTADFDKGSGVGLKNFTFEFNGTNPAEARKDIKATLSMHFQSFDDFVSERIASNGEIYRFVDLVLQPQKEAGKIIHRDQYNPSYYRIMAEVGYHIPTDKELKSMFPWYTDRAEGLVNALTRTNKAFYLCMIDHDFQINVDGTVNLTINYGAYVETILKTHQYDALATPEIVAQREANFNRYIEVVNEENCTQDALQRILSGLDAQEAIIRERSLQSIIQRLLKRNKIFVCQITEAQAVSFRTQGFFSESPVLKPLNSQTAEITAEDAIEEGQQTGVTDIILGDNFLPDDYNFNAPYDNTIQFFYFGDLLHTVLDTMYQADSPSLLREEVENCRFILGSFDFDVYKGGPNYNSTVNIGQIPISVEYFADWFTNNVIKKGETRKSFPIITFIRNLSSNLLQQSLLESCINRRIDKSFSFQMGQITAYDEGGEPLRNAFGGTDPSPVIDITKSRTAGIFPFDGDTVSEVKDIKNYHNYMYLGVLGSSLSAKGKGNYKEDNENGMYHIEIGSNKGIVKSVNFSKTDIQFIREARFFQQGIDGLLQLSNVYKVTVEMFGNTIFYPGMDIFLNPYGIGGNKLGSPTQGPQGGRERSLANKLGIGGYHTVTNVRSSVGVDGFKTTVQALMYYAGDGSSEYVKNGQAVGQTPQSINKVNEKAKNKNFANCEPIVAAVESDLSLVERGTPTRHFAQIDKVNQTANNVQNNASSATGVSQTSSNESQQTPEEILEQTLAAAGVKPEPPTSDPDAIPTNKELGESPVDSPSGNVTPPINEQGSGNPPADSNTQSTPTTPPDTPETPVEETTPTTIEAVTLVLSSVVDDSSVAESNYRPDNQNYDVSVTAGTIVYAEGASDGSEEFLISDLKENVLEVLSGYTSKPITDLNWRYSFFLAKDSRGEEIKVAYTSFNVNQIEGL